MQPAHPQHKRKGSAVDQLLDGPVSGGIKVARPSEEEAEAQRQAEGEQQERLTQTCQLHLLQLRASQEDLLRKIDDITAAGTALLEVLRASFTQRMAKVKEELSTMIDEAEMSLRANSASTLELQQRASCAAELVGKLNIRTMDQERPSVLLTEEQEPEEVDHGATE